METVRKMQKQFKRIVVHKASTDSKVSMHNLHHNNAFIALYAILKIIYLSAKRTTAHDERKEA